jgi:membrane associated rhomboid family serine protease
MLRELINQFRYGSVLKRLIFINSAVFILMVLPGVILKLTGSSFNITEECQAFFSFYSGWEMMLSHPWGILTYQFIHGSIWHLLINMLWLYWMGRIFLEFLGSRKLLSVYLAGGIAGALIFALAYNVFPYFASISHAASLIGSSASVLAITVATATLVPDYTIAVLFFGAVRLKYLAVAAIVIDLLSMTSFNAGGHFAHLGGALFGFIYIRQLRQGTDLLAWLEKLISWIENLFLVKRSRLRIVHRQSTGNDLPDQETIDRILDKISQSGYESLTAREKEILFRASKK